MNQTGVEPAEGNAFKVRGLLYGAVYGWLFKRYGGPERFDEFKITLPKSMQDLLSNFEEKKWHQNELRDWYPADELYFFYERLIDFLKPEMNEPEIIDGLVGFMFKQAISGFMKGLMSFLTPAALIKRSSTFWKRVHSSGEVTIKELGKGKLAVSLRGWKVHRISCAIFAGWTKHLMGLTGRTITEMKKTGCVLDGDEACTWDVVYR